MDRLEIYRALSNLALLLCAVVVVFAVLFAVLRMSQQRSEQCPCPKPAQRLMHGAVRRP